VPGHNPKPKRASCSVAFCCQSYCRVDLDCSHIFLLRKCRFLQALPHKHLKKKLPFPGSFHLGLFVLYFFSSNGAWFPVAYFDNNCHLLSIPPWNRSLADIRRAAGFKGGFCFKGSKWIISPNQDSGINLFPPI